MYFNVLMLVLVVIPLSFWLKIDGKSWGEYIGRLWWRIQKTKKIEKAQAKQRGFENLSIQQQYPCIGTRRTCERLPFLPQTTKKIKELSVFCCLPHLCQRSWAHLVIFKNFPRCHLWVSKENWINLCESLRYIMIQKCFTVHQWVHYWNNPYSPWLAMTAMKCPSKSGLSPSRRICLMSCQHI